MTRSLRLATMLTVVGLARVAGATTFVAMDERTLARSADAIVLGTVTGRDTVGTPDGGIYTLVTLSIEGRYKGDVGTTLVLKEPGGDLDDRGLVVGNHPHFPQVDADAGEIFGDKADVLVLGPAGQDLVTNDQNARCDDLTHFLSSPLSPDTATH